MCVVVFFVSEVGSRAVEKYCEVSSRAVEMALLTTYNTAGKMIRLTAKI